MGCAGLVGGAALGGCGAVVGYVIGSAFSRGSEPLDLTKEGLVGAGVGAGVGILLGTPTGACAFGEARHQGGRWGTTFLGALAGTAAGALAIFGVKGAPVLQLLGALMPATGAVIGYNLSRPRTRERQFVHRTDRLPIGRAAPERPSIGAAVSWCPAPEPGILTVRPNTGGVSPAASEAVSSFRPPESGLRQGPRRPMRKPADGSRPTARMHFRLAVAE